MTASIPRHEQPSFEDLVQQPDGPVVWQPHPPQSAPARPVQTFDPRCAVGGQTHPDAYARFRAAPMPGHPGGSAPFGQVRPEPSAQTPHPHAAEIAEPDRASLIGRIRALGQAEGRLQPGNRKPFLMGVLSGIVLMLLLGLVFRAAQPAPGYAFGTATTTVVPAATEPQAVAFLDRVAEFETATPSPRPEAADDP
ncbi:hypothetical protein [uncultured Algimonas sp.]|uniref:hypothetical protein n=1 Tax=uncultured Algimonas sp. TaxID=1547920 RepID=UPI002632E08B|nr:hypothetical protein [uncultured Algimonas sp.]